LKDLSFGFSSFLSRTGFFSLLFAGYGGGFEIALNHLFWRAAHLHDLLSKSHAVPVSRNLPYEMDFLL